MFQNEKIILNLYVVFINNFIQVFIVVDFLVGWVLIIFNFFFLGKFSKGNFI